MNAITITPWHAHWFCYRVQFNSKCLHAAEFQIFKYEITEHSNFSIWWDGEISAISDRTHVNTIKKKLFILVFYGINIFLVQGREIPVWSPTLGLLWGYPWYYAGMMFRDPGASPVVLPAVTLTLWRTICVPLGFLYCHHSKSRTTEFVICRGLSTQYCRDVHIMWQNKWIWTVMFGLIQCK